VTGLSVEAQKAGIKGTRKVKKEQARKERLSPLEKFDSKVGERTDRSNKLLADYIATGDKAAERRATRIRQETNRLERDTRPALLRNQRINRKVRKKVNEFKQDKKFWKANKKSINQQLKTQQGRTELFADITAADATRLSKTDSKLPITKKTEALNRPNEILERYSGVAAKQEKLVKRVERLSNQGRYGKVIDLAERYKKVSNRAEKLQDRYEKAKDRQVKIALDYVDNQKKGGTARLPSEKQAAIDNKNAPGLIEQAAKGAISFDSFKRIAGDQKDRLVDIAEGDFSTLIPEKESLENARDAFTIKPEEIAKGKLPGLAFINPQLATSYAGLELAKPKGEATTGDYIAAIATAAAAAKIASSAKGAGKAIISARKQARQGIDPDVLLGIKPATDAAADITARRILFNSAKRNVAGSKTADKTLSAINKIQKVTRSEDFKFIRKWVRRSAIIEAGLLHEYTLPAITGTIGGFIQDPGQTLGTTARGIISGVTSPLALIANFAISGSRAVTSIGAEGERDDIDYITHPVRELATQYWGEIQDMADVYLSKDAERIAKATQEDYGLLNAMGAYWIMRPLGKGVISTPARKVGTLITYKGADLTKVYDRWMADMASKGRLSVLNARLESAQQRVMRDLTKSLDRNLMDFNSNFRKRLGEDHEVITRYNNIIASMAEGKTVLEKGDMTARQYLDETMVMGDKERARILKEQFNAPTFADLAVYLQTTQTPLKNAVEVLRNRRESLDSTAEELVSLKILLDLPELLDTTTEIGRAFTKMRVDLLEADIRVLEADSQGYRDIDPATGKYSDPVDVETIINAEQQLAPEDRPKYLDDEGNEINIPYTDPTREGQIRRPEQMETDLRAKDQAELTQERRAIRKMEEQLAEDKKEATRLKNELERLEEADDRAKAKANKTEKEIKDEKDAQERKQELETELELVALRLESGRLQLDRTRQFDRDIKALNKPPVVKTKAPKKRVTGEDRKRGIKYTSDEGYSVTKRKDGWVVRDPNGKELGVTDSKNAADAVATDHLRKANVSAQRTKGNKEGTYVYGDRIPEGTIYKTERRGDGWVALGPRNKVLARGKTRTEVEAVLEPLLRADQQKALREDRKAYKAEQKALDSQLRAAKKSLKAQKKKLEQITKGWAARGYKRDPKLDKTTAKYEKQLEDNEALAAAIDFSDAGARALAAKLSGILTKEELNIVMGQAKGIIGDNKPVDARSLTPEEARKRTEEMTLARAATFGEMDALVDRRIELKDDRSAAAAEERLDIENRLEELRMEVAIQTALIEDADLMIMSNADAATIKAALQLKTAEKRRANYAPQMAVISRSFERIIQEVTDQIALSRGLFIPHNPSPDPGRNSASPTYGPTLSVKKERFRTGDQARSGNVDRSYAAWYEALQYQLKAASYRRITEHLLANDAVRFDLGLGEQVVFARDDRAMLEDRGVFMGESGQAGAVAEFPYRALSDPMLLQRVVKNMKVEKGGNFAEAFEASFQEVSRRDAKAEVSEMGLDPTTDEFRRQVELRAQKIAREGRGEGVVFIREAAIRRLFDQEKTFDSTFWRSVEAVNRWASKLVLGTSVSWVLAQPIAEFLVLAADNPRVMSRQIISLARRRARLIESGDLEGLRLLSFFADSTLGNDTITKRQQGGQTTARDAVREMRDQTFMGLQLQQLAKLETFGNIDRVKGAWIREVGVLAALDRELSFLTRASKAIKGQMDEIEKVADRLSKMSDAERLRFLDSEEGRKAGQRLVELIDDSLGNWTKLSPGERPIANLVFFYPFVRFSIRYVLYTYPKAHPVRWQLAAMFGLANAELLEQYLEEAPAFMSGWASIPIFGDNDETPSHILALNRIAPGGNAIVEMMGNFQSPYDLTKILTPPLGAGFRFVAGRDEWGNPVGSGKGGLFDTTPSFGNLVKEGVDTFTDLSPISREVKRHVGLSFDGPISDPRFKVLTGEDARPKRPGDDSGGLSGFLRRQFIPYLIPREIDAVKKEYKVSALWERYGELADIESREYSDLAKRGIERYEEEKAKVDAHGETFSPQYYDDLTNFQAFQRTNRAYGQYLREKGEKDQAEDMMRPIARTITKVYKGSDAPLESSEQFKDLATTEEQYRQDIREQWTAKRPGRSYPGFEQAKRDVNEWKGQPVTRASGPDDPQVSVKKPEKLVNIGAGLATTNRLRNNTKQYLSKQGKVRRPDVTNPLSDPRTRVRKNGTVARYRGEKVMGNIKLAELRAAENNNSLTTEKNTGMLMTPEVRQTYTHAVKQNELVRQISRRQAQLAEEAGGVPSGVPDKYKGLVKKWGAYLEREMTKNGLVGVDGGLPQGMSGAEYLAKILQAESSWDERIGHPDNTSSAQAQGLGQFIPSTRDAFLEQFGVDAYAGAEEQIKAAAFHLDGTHTAGGLNSYNPGFPADSDGTWGYYLNQDVGKVIPANKKAAKQLEVAKENLKQAKEKADRLYKSAKKQGIPVPRPEDGPVNEVAGPEKQKGPFAGSRRIVSQILGGPVMGDKYGADSDRDGYHWLDNAYAQDIQLGGGDPAEGEPIYNQDLLDQVTKRIREMGGTVPDLVMGMGYTEGYLKGYKLEIIPDSETNVHGTGAHLHIGAMWTGEKPPPGTMFGTGSGGGAGGSSPAAYSSGGSSVGLPQVSGKSKKMSAQNLMSLPLGSGGEDPQDLPSVIDSMSQTEGDGVESVTEQLANLPVPKKKKTPIRFNPANRI
jgi:hypothetical protein